MSKINRDLLCKAVCEWGKTAQVDMMIEECGELVSALSQERRGRKVDVASEIADVMIMAEQMRIMYGAYEVDVAINAKMYRLKQKLDIGDINA